MEDRSLSLFNKALIKVLLLYLKALPEVMQLRTIWMNLELKKRRVDYWEKYGMIPSESFLTEEVENELFI